MPPKRSGVFVAFPVFALTRKKGARLPGSIALKTTPRGLLVMKKLGLKIFGSAKLSGTPSQFISRLPEVNVCAVLGFSAPRSARNWSTANWIAAGLAPEPRRTSETALLTDVNTSSPTPVNKKLRNMNDNLPTKNYSLIYSLCVTRHESVTNVQALLPFNNELTHTSLFVSFG